MTHSTPRAPAPDHPPSRPCAAWCPVRNPVISARVSPRGAPARPPRRGPSHLRAAPPPPGDLRHTPKEPERPPGLLGFLCTYL